MTTSPPNWPIGTSPRYAKQLRIDLETLSSLGRYRPDDPSDSFCPTVLALRLAGARNGVSRLHGAVTRNQWGGLWPRLPLSEVPIGHVTNGIHFKSWISTEVEELLDRRLGPSWKTTPGSPDSWKELLGTEDEGLWDARCRARARLIEFTRVRRNEQLARRGADKTHLAAADAILDADALTIGFVGRFVAYKRPTLFLRDPDRLARILGDPDRPVQIIFGGKAHPRDEFGKELLRQVIEFRHQRHLEHRVVFIEDFDITMDRALSQGVDLWLNTPRRPLEACGIGGMKAGVERCPEPQHIGRLVGRGLARRGPHLGTDRLVHRDRQALRRLRGARRERRRVAVRGSRAPHHSDVLRPGRRGHPSCVARLGSRVDGEPGVDVALAPHGARLRRVLLPAVCPPRTLARG